MIYVLIFIASFLKIFFAAIQQKNVINNDYKMMPIASYTRAITEAFTISATAVQVTNNGWIEALWVGIDVGTASWIACVSAAWLYDKIRGNKV